MESFTGVKREYHENGTLYSENYYEDDKRHRIGGPAEIVYDNDGTIIFKIYYENGKKHRIGGPAEIKYGKEYTRYIYYQEGKYCNPYSPVEFRLTNKNFIVYKDYYSKTGKMSNVKGPAVINTVSITWGIYGFNTVIDHKTF